MSLNYQITAVLITRNEERNIARCLNSLSFCSEIIIVDSFSTDKTKEISLSYPQVKFFEAEFLGYGPQKQLAVSKASHDWIFSIDADEWCTDELQRELSSFFHESKIPELKIYAIPRTLIFLNRPLNFSGENRRPVVRFFHKSFANFNDAKVHEEVLPLQNENVQVKPSGQRMKGLNGEIMHLSYHSLSDYILRMNHYSEAMAKKIVLQNSSPKLPNPFTLLLRFKITFIKIYFLRLGILDGMRGLIWSLSSAYANVIKYAKYYELLCSINNPSHKNKITR